MGPKKGGNKTKKSLKNSDLELEKKYGTLEEQRLKAQLWALNLKTKKRERSEEEEVEEEEEEEEEEKEEVPTRASRSTNKGRKKIRAATPPISDAESDSDTGFDATSRIYSATTPSTPYAAGGRRESSEVTVEGETVDPFSSLRNTFTSFFFGGHESYNNSNNNSNNISNNVNANGNRRRFTPTSTHIRPTTTPATSSSRLSQPISSGRSGRRPFSVSPAGASVMMREQEQLRSHQRMQQLHEVQRQREMEENHANHNRFASEFTTNSTALFNNISSGITSLFSYNRSHQNKPEERPTFSETRTARDRDQSPAPLPAPIRIYYNGDRQGYVDYGNGYGNVPISSHDDDEDSEDRKKGPPPLPLQKNNDVPFPFFMDLKSIGTIAVSILVVLVSIYLTIFSTILETIIKWIWVLFIAAIFIFLIFIHFWRRRYFNARAKVVEYVAQQVKNNMTISGEFYAIEFMESEMIEQLRDENMWKNLDPSILERVKFQSNDVKRFVKSIWNEVIIEMKEDKRIITTDKILEGRKRKCWQFVSKRGGGL